jgi:glutaredoxin 3
MAAEVVIYTTKVCPYCVRAKMLLDRKGVAYQDIDVSNDTERRQWLVTATGQRTVPQIFIGGKSVGGCDELQALDRAGKLEEMLNAPQ